MTAQIRSSILTQGAADLYLPQVNAEAVINPCVEPQLWDISPPRTPTSPLHFKEQTESLQDQKQQFTVLGFLLKQATGELHSACVDMHKVQK